VYTPSFDIVAGLEWLNWSHLAFFTFMSYETHFDFFYYQLFNFLFVCFSFASRLAYSSGIHGESNAWWFGFGRHLWMLLLIGGEKKLISYILYTS